MRRQTGLGWRPASWQGWLLTVVLLGVVLGSLLTLRGPTRLLVTLAAVALYGLTAAVISRGHPVESGSGSGTAEADRPTTPDRSRGDRTTRGDRPPARSPGSMAGALRRSSAPAPHGVADPRGDEPPAVPRPGNPPAAGSVAASGAAEPGKPIPAAISTRTAVAAAPVSPFAPAGAQALVVDHLTKRFGDRVALEDVSFSVAHGEVFGFLGPNGAGKTTTVRTLGTVIAPTSGSATIAGLRLEPANGVAIRRRISIMPETPGLYLRLTVADNLQFFAGLFGVADAPAKIASALDAVNLSARADERCANLSKGLRQRVGLARALLNDPAVLFLDEPTSGLDPVATREVHGLINGLRERGVTVFLTTHRLEEAERLCDRVAILNTRLQTLGTPDELRASFFRRSLTVRTAAPLAEPDRVFGPIGSIEGWDVDETGAYKLRVSDPTTAAPAVTRALVAAGADVLAIGESRHTLEDVYLELVDEDVEATSA